MTPAMAAGVADRLWDVADLVALWEQYEGEGGKSGIIDGLLIPNSQVVSLNLLQLPSLRTHIV